MSSSNVGNRVSRFSNSDQLASNFIFNSSQFPESGSEKEPLPSPSVYLNTRLQKIRKQTGSQHPRLFPGRGNHRGDSGFNQFQPVLGNYSSVSHGSDKTLFKEFGKTENDGFSFGSNHILNANSTMGKQLVDQMRELGINKTMHLNTKGVVHNLSVNHVQRGTQCIKASAIRRAWRGRNVRSVNNVDISSKSLLPNEMNKLNIRGSNEFGSGYFGSDPSVKGAFIFGSSKQQKGTDSVPESLDATLSNQMTNLNLKSPEESECFDGRAGNTLLDEMNRLQIRIERDNASLETQPISTNGKSISIDFTVNAGAPGTKNALLVPNIDFNTLDVKSSSELDYKFEFTANREMSEDFRLKNMREDLSEPLDHNFEFTVSSLSGTNTINAVHANNNGKESWFDGNMACNLQDGSGYINSNCNLKSAFGCSKQQKGTDFVSESLDSNQTTNLNLESLKEFEFFDGRDENTLLDEMNRLQIRIERNAASLETQPIGENGKSIPIGFTLNAGTPGTKNALGVPNTEFNMRGVKSSDLDHNFELTTHREISEDPKLKKTGKNLSQLPDHNFVFTASALARMNTIGAVLANNNGKESCFDGTRACNFQDGSCYISYNPSVKSAFIFGSNKQQKGTYSVPKSMDATLSNQMNNLNLKSLEEFECFDGRAENTLLDEMNRLQIKIERDTAALETQPLNTNCKSISTGFTVNAGTPGTKDALGVPSTESNRQDVKSSSDLDHNFEYTANREISENPCLKNTRENLSQLKENFVPIESDFQSNLESFESYSPMEVSSYQEILAKNAKSSEDESINSIIHSDIDNTEKCGETKGESSDYMSAKDISVEGFSKDSISGPETDSFKSANEQLDTDSDCGSTAAEVDNCSSSKIENQIQFSFTLGTEHIGKSNFTFAASSQPQFPASTRQHKKKNRSMAGYGSCTSTQDARDTYAPLSVKFFPLSGASILSLRRSVKTDPLNFQPKGKNSSNVKHDINRASVSASAAAHEACEKWRLRGNQAYASGDLNIAEDCYSQGLNCVSQNETSKICLRALMLCYSNRIATRMSLGRMREALGDCMMASEIDPSFLRVQVRAANCFLALGEVEDAVRCFNKCLKSDVVKDQKIAAEASEGLQNAQKVSNCIIRSRELLQQRRFDDAQSALEIITDALSVSLYSEKLLEMKAEALFMMQKYEEVIHLCNQTLGSAVKNSPLIGGDGNSENIGISEFSRFWRLNMSFNSYFYLGKLQEAINIVETREGSGNESKDLESTIPLIATVRKILHHKILGNEAFQSGRHPEAIEHYTSALSCSAESRLFAAICFCNRAAAFKSLGQITDALADCNLAIALDENYLKAISRRATLFELIRDYQLAANDLHRLLTNLERQVEDKKANHSSERSASLVNDIRQAQLRLSTVEEEAKKDITLDMYLILGIEPTTSTVEIRKAYRKAALRHHPDKAGQYLTRGERKDDEDWKKMAEEVRKDADRIFKMIGEAYAVLSDPSKRSQYDMEEEMRNNQSRCDVSSKSQRTRNNFPNYPFESSKVRQPWRNIHKSYGTN